MALTPIFGTPVSSTGAQVIAGAVTFTVTEAANQTLYVGFAFDDQGATARTATVTYGGSSMTRIDGSTLAGPFFEVFKLTDPPTGSALDVLISGTPDFANRQWNVIPVVVNDNDQGTPNDAANRFNSAASSNTSLTTTSALLDGVLSFVCVDNKSAASVQPNAGPSTHVEISGAGGIYVGASFSDGAASVNTGWNWPGNAIATEIAFNLNVAAAAAAASKRLGGRLTYGVGG